MSGQNLNDLDWLRLGEAADYLGIHFNTLRRWADSGDLPVYKTPGGRRRFKKSDLDDFLGKSKSVNSSEIQPALNIHPDEHVIQKIKHLGIRDEPWYEKISPSHRQIMSKHGRMLVGVFMQYMSQQEKKSVFLDEGKKLAATYGQICSQTGLSLTQTVHAFVLIRHAITDTLCGAGMVVQDSGEQTWKLYQRVNHFFDLILITLLNSFQDAKHPNRSVE